MRGVMRFLVALIALAAGACGSVTVEPDGGAGGCGACSPNATCVAEACVCNAGFQGSGTVCSDINECATDNGGCHADATCANTPGSRTCTCDPGFAGDGLACHPVWTLHHAVPGTLLGYWNQVTGFGNQIFFAHEGSTDAAFHSLDVVTLAVDEEGLQSPDNDLCSCGYGGRVVGAAGFLWMFANYGHRYDPSTDTWTNATYPYENQRGEAAVAVNDSTGSALLVYVGGRGPLNTVEVFDPATQTWSTAYPDYPFFVESAGAAATPNGNVYVFGGRTSFDASNKAAVLQPGIGWTVLADTPVDLNRPDVVAFQGKIYVSSYGSPVHIFDPATNQWDGTPIPPPPDVANLRLTATTNDLWFVGDGAGGVTFFRYTP